MEEPGRAIFYVLSKYFWIFGIFVTSMPVFAARKAAKDYARENPDLAPGYRKLFCGYLILLSLPWIVMGVGCTVGGVPSVWHFFNPKDGNPYVLAWFASNFIMLAVISYWIFFMGGAQMLIRHHNVLSIDTSNPAVIKLVWTGFLVLGITILLIMWTVHIPIEELPYMDTL